jgi:hypothetical protein
LKGGKGKIEAAEEKGKMRSEVRPLGAEDRGQGSEEFQSTDGLVVSVTLGVRASDKTSEWWIVVECKPEAKLKVRRDGQGRARQTDRRQKTEPADKTG